jgi:hypothetical protein
LALVGFGATGLRGESAVRGLAANVALAVIALVLGLALVVGSLLWRDLSHLVYLGVGGALMTIGLAMLAVLKAFGANMTSCLTTLTVGLVIFVAGTYTRTGTAEEAEEKERRRHGNPRPEPVTATVGSRPAAQRRPTKTVPRRPASAR